MRRIKEKRYTPEEVAKIVKYIDGVYYIDVTEEGKRLFGETIIDGALVRLDLSWILRAHMPRECMDEYSEKEYYSEIIRQKGEGKVFEVVVNAVLDEKHKIQVNVSDGVECLVIRFTNGKEMFISNSEWGEVSSTL